MRQVPFFTALALDPPRPDWRRCVRAMRGVVLRYVAIFVLAMLPVVALGESAFRRAMLFVHFPLGASIGAVTTLATLRGADALLPRR